jgi:DNA repair protein RecO (recombination protein O)
MLKKDKAVCIRAVDYSETSQIVTFFTSEYGKISAIAKGSKRQKTAFDGPIEVLAEGQIVFSDSEKSKLSTLTEFQQQNLQTNLSEKMFILNFSLFACELVNKLTDERDPHPRLYDFFSGFLKDIRGIQEKDDEKKNALVLLILFQLSILKEVGLQPVLNYCPNCKTQYSPRNTQYGLYFSKEAGGLICRDCEANFPDKIPVTKTAGQTLYNLKNISETNEKTLKEIENILIDYFTNIIGKLPRLAKHVLG